MTDFLGSFPIPEEDRLPALSDMLEDFLTPQLAQQADPVDPSRQLALYIEQMELDLPIEIQLQRDEEKEKRFVLGTSPPTQWIETSVQPVLHRLRLTLELDNDEPGKQRLES